jgi:hypothetical protein
MKMFIKKYLGIYLNAAIDQLKADMINYVTTIAATGRQLKQSVKVFHSFALYLLLHSS